MGNFNVLLEQEKDPNSCGFQNLVKGFCLHTAMHHPPLNLAELFKLTSPEGTNLAQTFKLLTFKPCYHLILECTVSAHRRVFTKEIVLV
jgi:hypothetical protein